MSFVSTFPANAPKFSYVAGPTVPPTSVTGIDTAIGIDSISSFFRQLFDYGSGSEKSLTKPFTGDLGVGGELSSIKCKGSDSGSGIDKVAYRYLMSFESGKGYELVVKRLIQVLELAKALDALVPSAHASLSAALNDVSMCLSRISSMYGEVDYNKEVKAVHFTAVADCALKLASAVGRFFQALKLKGVKLSDDVYNQFTECWRLIAAYPELRSADIIEPEHENQLIDIVACLDSLYGLLKLIIAAVISDSGAGLDAARMLDVSPVSDRLTYVNTPIPYYTDQLSPPGGYVLTAPPVTFKTAYVGSLLTSAWGLSLYVNNISKGWSVSWSDKSGANICAKVTVYSDGWVLAWIEDRCWGGADWDYYDMATGVRAEVLDGVTYIHAIFLEHVHADTDQSCIVVQGTTYCSGKLGAYSGSIRVVWETWIKVA